jgi:hypothetical protein
MLKQHRGKTLEELDGFRRTVLLLSYIDDGLQDSGDLMERRDPSGRENMKEGRERDRDGLVMLLEVPTVLLKHVNIPLMTRDDVGELKQLLGKNFDGKSHFKGFERTVRSAARDDGIRPEPRTILAAFTCFLTALQPSRLQACRTR